MEKGEIYHVVTTPESVKSLVKTGVFPDNLSDYVVPQQIEVLNIFQKPCLSSHTHKDQVFIVEVATDVILLDAINPKDITRVFVNSDKSARLFKRLTDNSDIKTIVAPSLFASFNRKTVSTKRKKENNQEKNDDTISDTYRDLEKKLKSEKPDTQIVLPKRCLTRLCDAQEHEMFVRKAFTSAKKQILITSYSIKHETFKRLNLYNLMREAREKGVKIYIYYSDQKDVDDEVFKFIEEQKIFLDYTTTHSKLFVVDDHTVAIGSFNWLSAVSNRFPYACDGTIVLQDRDICASLKGYLWKHIKRYRNYQYNNRKQIRKFESREFNYDAIEYSLDKKSSAVYLPTLEQQCAHLAESFEVAERNIVICSPFISMNGEFFQDFDKKTLRQLSKRKIEVIFVCNVNDKNLANFENFLENEVNSKHVHLVVVSTFHLKTIIVDDEEICEGSFNWLSAVRDESSEYHNHEAALVVDGPMADRLIEHFYESPVGQAIQAYFRNLSEEKDARLASQESLSL